MSEAPPSKASPKTEEGAKAVPTVHKQSVKQKKVESLHRHKENVKKAVTELEEIQEKLSEPKPKKVSFQKAPTQVQAPVPLPVQLPVQSERKESFVKHKENVERAVESLKTLELSLKSEVQMKSSNRAEEELDTTLQRKQYAEEEIDYKIAAKDHEEKEEEKCYRWVEKSIDRVYWIASILTLIGSILTAFNTYMFVFLPKVLYSHHILHETFLLADQLININNFGRPFGLHDIAFLPMAIILMFLFVLYLAYLVQYPRQTGVVRIVRYVIFAVVELYLILCAISYSIDVSDIGTRLDAYFAKDKEGLVDANQQNYGKLYFLDHSQTYFGCCGFKSDLEWKDAYPNQYQTTWPLSCCSEEISGIACYGPVRRKLKYIPPRKQEEKDFEPEVEKDRLHGHKCYDMEKELAETVSALIIVFILIYILLSLWSIYLTLKIAAIVTSKNLEIKTKPQYVDFF